MIRQVASILKRKYFELLRTRGCGWPVPAAVWDNQYQSGQWNYLRSAEELGHYMVIAGYTFLTGPLDRRPSILDAGCGSGRLLAVFKGFGFASYTGVDCSAEALRQAAIVPVDNTRFVVADLESWEPDREQRYDVIIFNESLYYLRRPTRVLRRFGDWLAPGGMLIVSMYRHGNQEQEVIWQNALEHFSLIGSTTVVNGQGHTWDIRALVPK
jgi:SAM-dependent methyltransferase